MLQAELLRRGGGSAAFGAFLVAWAADEEKHALGLRWPYGRVFDDRDTDERLESRQSAFDGLDSFLDDPFRLAVMLAYDEAMSAHGYGADIPFYTSLAASDAESVAFGALLRELRADEAMHDRNAIELIATNHADRIEDVQGAVDEVVALEGAGGEYRGSFLLDHASDQFSSDAMIRTGSAAAR